MQKMLLIESKFVGSMTIEALIKLPSPALRLNLTAYNLSYQFSCVNFKMLQPDLM